MNEIKGHNDIYFEQQRNWFIIIFIGIILAAVITVASIQDDISLKDLLIIIAAMGSIFIFVSLLTYKQVVIADSIGVTVTLGIGLFKHSFTYDIIDDVSVVKISGRNIASVGLPPFAGASLLRFRGFNHVSQSMIYNIGMCRRGVSILQPGKRKSLHVIGSRNPEELAAFIQKRLPPNRSVGGACGRNVH